MLLFNLLPYRELINLSYATCSIRKIKRIYTPRILSIAKDGKHTKTDYAGKIPSAEEIQTCAKIKFFLIEFHLLPNHVNISFRLSLRLSASDPLVCPFADTFMFAMYLWPAQKRQQKTSKTRERTKKSIFEFN